MTEQTNALPKNIQEAIQLHDECKAKYMEMRTRLASLYQRLDKHRKTAAAAEHEAQTARDTWRERFHANDGEITKEIRDLRRQEGDARELAKEYALLADELVPQAGLFQIEVYDAQVGYARSRDDAHDLYAYHSLKNAAQTLLALPQARPVLAAMVSSKQAIARDVTVDPAFDTGPTAHGQRLASSERERRFDTLVRGMLDAAFEQYSRSPGEPDPVMESLRPLARLDEEAPSGTFAGLVSRMKRQNELNGMAAEAQQAKCA
jgi:hypothetical protein